jgi:hypothetical protein
MRLREEESRQSLFGTGFAWRRPLTRQEARARGSQTNSVKPKAREES